MVGFVIGFPEGNPFVALVRVDNILDVSLEVVLIFRVMLAHVFAGGDEPAAVVHAENRSGIFVTGR